MNKKEKKQFEKQLKDDIIKYLVSSDINLDNKKEINKKLKDFPNKYYTEIKYELFIDDNDTININYKEDINND